MQFPLDKTDAETLEKGIKLSNEDFLDFVRLLLQLRDEERTEPQAFQMVISAKLAASFKKSGGKSFNWNQSVLVSVFSKKILVYSLFPSVHRMSLNFLGSLLKGPGFAIFDQSNIVEKVELEFGYIFISIGCR